MGANSKIGWTDHTFNPWIGCQHVSPGCDHCYAEAMSNRYGWTTWGPHGERKKTSDANWRKPIEWNKAAKAMGVRQRVFCASLADWLDNQAPDSWRESLAILIDATPNLDWLLLTKRPENLDKHAPWHHDDVPPNAWLGITAETQEHFDRRWPLIREYQAKVHFVSNEPALGPLTLPNGDTPDWIITGAESGPGRRPFREDWVRHIRDECQRAGVYFFYKQVIDARGRKIELPEIDGRQWAEFPA